MIGFSKRALQIVVVGFIVVKAFAPAAAQDGWVTLFDGKNLDRSIKWAGQTGTSPKRLSLPIRCPTKRNPAIW